MEVATELLPMMWFE